MLDYEIEMWRMQFCTFVEQTNCGGNLVCGLLFIFCSRMQSAFYECVEFVDKKAISL